MVHVEHCPRSSWEVPGDEADWPEALSILPLSSWQSEAPGTSALQLLLPKASWAPTTPQPRIQTPEPPAASSSRGLALLPAWLVSVGLQTRLDLIICEEGHVARVVDRQELPVLQQCWPRLERVARGSGRGRGSCPHLVPPSGVSDPAAWLTPRVGLRNLLYKRPQILPFPGTMHPGSQPPFPQTQEVMFPSSPPPRTQESGLPALAFTDLEEPGEDVKLEDGHVATAGEVNGGAQGQGRGARFHWVAGAQERLELSPGQHTPGWRGLGYAAEASGNPGWEDI